MNGEQGGRRVYFDHNSTTYARTEVVEAMIPFFHDRFGNSNSLHFFGQETRSAVDKAREDVAALIGAEPDEIVFTSGGTESDNLAVRGILKARDPRSGPAHIVTSGIEHPAVMNTCNSLEKDGVEVTYVPCTGDGIVRVDLIEEAIRPETVLVSVMLANNETGVIQPIREISRLTRERGITMHTDAVQAVGKILVDVEDLGVELLSISAHKFYGPKGVGALYVRRGTPIKSVYTGGGQEFGLRSGTTNAPAVVGFGEACRISKKELPAEMEYVGGLRDRLESGIRDQLVDIEVNGAGVERVPNTCSLTVPHVEGEAVILNLSMLGFAVSSRSACSSDSEEPSYVLQSMGKDSYTAKGAVRISLGIGNTSEDVDAFLEVFPGVVRRLWELSPLKEFS